MTSSVAGKPGTFIAAVIIIIVWAVSGPIFSFSDTWQLVINTGTTIITFLMVFLIQNTQNRDAMAVQLKLDELILAVKAARNEAVEIENLDEAALEDKRNEMIDLAEHAEQDVSEIKEIAEEEKASGEDET